VAIGNVDSSLLKKKSGSLEQRSTNSDTLSSNQSTGVMTKSMARAVAVIAQKEQLRLRPYILLTTLTPTCMTEAVELYLLTHSRKNPLQKLKTKHQSPFFEVEDYYSSESSMSSPKKVVFSQSEVK